MPLRVRILHQGRTLREVRANITVEVQPSPPASPGTPAALGSGLSRGTVPPPQDPDFAEVLSDLSARELQWLVQGQLRIVAETEGRHARQLAGTITTRRSCDSEHGHPGVRGVAVPPSPTSPPHPPPLLSPRVQAIQSVLCGADALLPTKTGAVGSAKLALHENGTLQYQVRGTGAALAARLRLPGVPPAAAPRHPARRCGWWARPARWWASRWRPNPGGRTRGTCSST